MKRTQRSGTPRPGRNEPEARPGAALERHSGEGSASALETLQKLEINRRLPASPTDSAPEDLPASGPAPQRPRP